MYIIFISCMQVYIYTSPQCQAAKVSQLPERDAGERRLVTTLAQQHLKVQVYRIYIGQKLPCQKLTAVTHRKSFGFMFHEYIMRTNLFLVQLVFFMHHVYTEFLHHACNYTSIQVPNVRPPR